MYCPTEWHDNHSKHKTLEDFKSNWQSIYNKTASAGLTYKISFTGGEVTTNKNFLPFVEWLKTEYAEVAKILVTTNGSATLEYYSKLFEFVDNISFSIHSEHVDEIKFFDMISQLRQKTKINKFIHVNIMNEFWNQDRIQAYKKLLEQTKISHSINEVDYTKQTRSIPIIKGKLNLAI